MIAIKTQVISPIAADVYDGLTAMPKRLPPKLFYDAAGSALFEEITRLPEYYLTRTEAAILQANAAEICRLAGSNVTVVELAAGSATKTRLLLAQLLRSQLRVTYAPVDVSPAALAEARQNVEQSLPGVDVQPLIGDFSDVSFLSRFRGPRLVLFIGSTIGNLEETESSDLLRRIAEQLGAHDRLLLGTDLVKSPAVLLPAYNDAAGVTARFNRNVLARINRELGGDFDLATFTHRATWNARRSRMEMHLESSVRQQARIRDLGLRVGFARGERIHTENSYKYTLPSLCSLLMRSGLQIERTWLDDKGWYGLHLIRAH